MSVSALTDGQVFRPPHSVTVCSCWLVKFQGALDASLPTVARQVVIVVPQDTGLSDVESVARQVILDKMIPELVDERTLTTIHQKVAKARVMEVQRLDDVFLHPRLG